MSSLLATLPPRSFVDFTVPKRPDGTDLESCDVAGDYEQYIGWLADYLYRTTITLSADQERWLEAEPRSPDGVVFSCSDVYGYAVDDLDMIASYFESGTTHADYQAEMYRLWLETTELEDREEFAFEELSAEAFARLRREWLQEKSMKVEWHHADIPYRALLSWALRQISDPHARKSQIDGYFRNFTDNASK